MEYRRVCRLIPDNTSVFLQPIVLADLIPVYITECRLPSELPFNDNHHVYFMPIHSYYLDTLISTIEDFYKFDTLPDIHDSISDDIVFNQCILLNHPDMPKLSAFRNANLIYVEVMVKERVVHLFLCADSPENVWELLTTRYNCVPLMVIDSQKGFGDSFNHTELYKRFMSCNTPAALPRFYFAGDYIFYAPDNFRPVCSTIFNLNNYDIYLTPWGEDDPVAMQCVETIIQKQADREETVRKLWDEIERFMADPTGEPPVEVIRSCLRYCREDMEQDGGVTDFNNTYQRNYYQEYSHPSGENFTPTVRLTNRARYFFLLAWQFALEDKPMTSPIKNKLYEVLNYHIIQKEKHNINPHEFVYFSANIDLRCFAESIYNYVKFLSSYRSFANMFAQSAFNYLEEEMLRCAYRKKDAPFAEWIIENCYFGSIQPELFDIIYREDKEKAADVASRFLPVCVARILNYTCRVNRRTGQMEPSQQIRFVFEHITKDCALQMKQYIRNYEKTEPAYMRVYNQLLSEYFSVGTDN